MAIHSLLFASVWFTHASFPSNLVVSEFQFNPGTCVRCERNQNGSQRNSSHRNASKLSALAAGRPRSIRSTFSKSYNINFRLVFSLVVSNEKLVQVRALGTLFLEVCPSPSAYLDPTDIRTIIVVERAFFFICQMARQLNTTKCNKNVVTAEALFVL